MADNETKQSLNGEVDSAEAKRAAARRRFLKQGAAAGTGALVVTLHHQRAIAAGKKIMTSSAATCTSLHGTVKGTKQVRDATNPTGPKVTVTECEIPTKSTK